MSELQQQLKESIEELTRIRMVGEHMRQLTSRLQAEEKALQVMEATLTKEQRDVEALEREGLTSMFRKFLGDREEKLEKEREEYLKASLRYNEIYKSVELIRFELELLQRKEQSHDAVAGRIEVLMKEREAELMRLNPAVATILQGIHEQTDRLVAYRAEVDQASAAGQQALDFVRAAEQNLHAALLMGQRNMWGSRQYGAGQQKHQYIDLARDMAYKSRHALIQFGNELKDVFHDMELRFNMEIEDFGAFANIFFENLISDFIVQQKISKSLTNVTGTRQQVELIMQQLQQELDTIRGKLEALDEERKKVIVTAG